MPLEQHRTRADDAQAVDRVAHAADQSARRVGGVSRGLQQLDRGGEVERAWLAVTDRVRVRVRDKGALWGTESGCAGKNI